MINQIHQMNVVTIMCWHS